MEPAKPAEALRAWGTSHQPLPFLPGLFDRRRFRPLCKLAGRNAADRQWPREEGNYWAFALSTIAWSSTCAPAPQSFFVAASISLCEMPSSHGMNTIAVGATRER